LIDSQRRSSTGTIPVDPVFHGPILPGELDIDPITGIKAYISTPRWRRPCVAIVAFALGLGCARTTRDALYTPPPPGVTRLELKGNVIRYGEKVLRFHDRIETWISALGPPSKTEASSYWWFGNSVEVAVSQTADGREYVAPLFVHLGENGYADGFVLQGIVLTKVGPPLRDVIDALSGTETELWGRWVRGRYEGAEMRVASPDGFVVSVNGNLTCLPPPDRSTGKCVTVISDLEIEGHW
jgi:hypothetical protein